MLSRPFLGQSLQRWTTSSTMDKTLHSQPGAACLFMRKIWILRLSTSLWPLPSSILLFLSQLFLSCTSGMAEYSTVILPHIIRCTEAIKNPHNKVMQFSIIILRYIPNLQFYVFMNGKFLRNELLFGLSLTYQYHLYLPSSYNNMISQFLHLIPGLVWLWRGTKCRDVQPLRMKTNARQKGE